MDTLPLEIMVEILSNVPSNQLGRCAQVCREWTNLLSAQCYVSSRTTMSSSLPNSPLSSVSSSSSLAGHDDAAASELSSAFLRPIKRICTSIEQFPSEIMASVWKRRLQRYYSEWLDILPYSLLRNYQWLCRACDNVRTDFDIKNGYTGLGRVEKYQLNTACKLANVDGQGGINGGDNEQDDRSIVGAVKYLHSYVGEFKDGKFHGVGLLRPSVVILQPPTGVKIPETTHSSNYNYIACEWKDGNQHGYGRCTYENAHYIGYYKRGYRHGKGEYFWDNGAKYKGSFKHNVMWGRGIYEWHGGTMESDWKLNKQHGHCVIQWITGCVFQGHYKYGVRKGHGIYRWSDGGIYNGGWCDMNRHGEASMTFANGIIFKGLYYNDQRNGHGTLTWPNGDTYTGNWSMGGRHGPGIFTEAATGKTSIQHWDEQEVRYSRGANKHPL